MMLARLGSLNALEQSRKSPFWRRWLGSELPSADTMGRVCQLVDVETLREANHEMYARLKRSKTLAPPTHGLVLAVFDAHESHATYRRRCDGCLQRTIHTKEGDRVQYYHRTVTVQLVTANLFMLLDAEPIQPGEDEIAAALRLFDRWHGDHVYKHQDNAMLVFWLLTMLAYNLFFTFYRRNFKSAVRDAYDTLQIGHMVIADLYHGLANRPRTP